MGQYLSTLNDFVKICKIKFSQKTFERLIYEHKSTRIAKKKS